MHKKKCDETSEGKNGIFNDSTSVLRGRISQKSQKLSGKEIAICVTGSVASIMSPKLARELRRYGAEVRGYMTNAAVEYGVSPEVMEWATGHRPVLTLSGAIEHLQAFDVVLVYPATYNTIGKLASGIADNAVTTLCGAIEKDKLLIVPAMNLQLWTSPILKENIHQLKKKGVTVVQPDFREGMVKIAGVQEVTDVIIVKSRTSRLKGRHVLILTGPLQYDIDPIRHVSSRSTGKTGYYLSRESIHHGCETTVIYGPGQVEMPEGVKVYHVYSTEEMLDTALQELKDHHYDIVLFPAAVLDFKPEAKPKGKIQSGQKQRFYLEPTPKIINNVNSQFPTLFTVGFKLLHNVKKDQLIETAHKALKEQQSDIIVANDLTKIHGEYHPAHFIDKDESFKSINASKEKLAEHLFTKIESRM
ncbi:MAG: bifunctional phosphopantothenoylcysteine decarboxylase/phosphopantothenate--cysteine ligase CoaBC [Candidatus Korarchaeota archaeon]|nr:bifunctional phosphopantothenoylcysteine decarboxylase/phosphopantothenate--cysteine ligase CoaBC [Candidatus Korarchaeota archaeon]NIU83010.1 bifunctional phosphopantothenoylcysteine decarboxylase/phosphopantothenate--cysteine ligase CoaBC [Candidatus Thorarchaeota archaeon]NIW13444.1 bifunctional phosphopantothenoylcysteine decarboxylase/phosphopantothenate--cysteine ligase CoaBC [Candidatus Thorarchaeota archaeon]NIW51552.1 bifunctional phosphopantothenoylcysteine decarboxylase/phosphopant